jgi:hypothetical protein
VVWADPESAIEVPTQNRLIIMSSAIVDIVACIRWIHSLGTKKNHFGKRANIILPKMLGGIDTNSRIVNEIMIQFFLVMTVSGLSEARSCC